MMEKYNVNAYFAGHDHCAEHINEGTPHAVDYHGMGATHLLDPSTIHKSKIPADSLKWHYGSTKANKTGDAYGAFAHITIGASSIRDQGAGGGGFGQVSMQFYPIFGPAGRFAGG